MTPLPADTTGGFIFWVRPCGVQFSSPGGLFLLPDDPPVSALCSLDGGSAYKLPRLFPVQLLVQSRDSREQERACAPEQERATPLHQPAISLDLRSLLSLTMTNQSFGNFVLSLKRLSVPIVSITSFLSRTFPELVAAITFHADALWSFIMAK